MRARGLEPPGACAQRDLNPPRLPVPPRPLNRPEVAPSALDFGRFQYGLRPCGGWRRPAKPGAAPEELRARGGRGRSAAALVLRLDPLELFLRSLPHGPLEPLARGEQVPPAEEDERAADRRRGVVHDVPVPSRSVLEGDPG